MPDYTDDPTILNDADLWRRIHPDHIVPDNSLEDVRISSAAFKDHPDGSPMSVLLADVVSETGREPADALAGYGDYAMAAFTAGLARECAQGVARQPFDDEPAHAVVFGDKPRRVRKELSSGSRWVIFPSGR